MAPRSRSLQAALLVLVMFITSSANANHKPKETNMSLFFQDVAAGPKATLIPVAGIAGKLWTFTQFGTIYATDEPITEGPEPNSTPIGRAQGMYITASSDGKNAHVMFSIVFTNKVYNGSTLQIQGQSKQFEQVREVSVVSGTGIFRFARGYATLENYFSDIRSARTIIRCNISVLHYN